ncbi:hypothetical protein NBRC116188_13930 [Oceaniserpentilla sp. 4NH20-0058]
MITSNISKAIARYYVRLKLEEMARLAYKKGDMESYKKYQVLLKKLTEK